MSGLNMSNVNDFITYVYNEASINVSVFLAEYAEEMLTKAIENKGFMHDTHNLRDSYIWIVYYNGKVDEYGFLGVEEADEPNDGLSGRDQAVQFMNSYSAIRKGWEVVLAAAMYYGLDLEEGKTYGGNKYVVISQIFNELTGDFGDIKILEKYG